MSESTKEDDNFKRDGVFLIPQLPASRLNSNETNDLENGKSNDKNKDKNVNNQQKNNEVKKFPPALTAYNPPSNTFHLEVIKDGTLVNKLFLNKNIIILGRSADCDLSFDHYSVSRYHAALYWCNGDSYDTGFFYLNDLNSSHGTFLNKTKVEQNKFLKLQPGKSFIRLGGSTRLILFDCKTNNEDEEDSVYEDPQLVNKKHNLISRLPDKKDDSESCSWGMDLDYEANRDQLNSESNLQMVLDIVNDSQTIDNTDNENAYLANPQKTIQNWFDYEGYDYEYVIQTEVNKFRCTINFPIDNESVPIIGEEEIKKKDAIINCCLRACKILDKAGLLFAWQKSNKIEKRKLDSDDELDDLIDETGERESKKQRLELLRTKRVDNLDSLSVKLDELNVEIEQLQNDLNDMDKEMNSGKSGSSKDDVELDIYVEKMSTKSKYSLNDLKIKKSKSRMKMSQLLKEKERTEKLLKIAKPSLTLVSSKKGASSTGSTKASELIQKALAKKKQDEVIEIEKPPVNKSLHKIELRSNIFKEDSDDKPVKTNLTFNKPTKLNPTISTFSLEPEIRKKPALLDLNEPNVPEALSELNEIENKEEIKEVVNKSDNKSNKKSLKSRDADEIKEEDEDNYCEWLPPEEDDEDKSSKLNDKYGY